MKRLLVTCLLVLVAACGRPHDTPLPKDLEKMDTIKPAMEKLSPEERELLAGYVVRHTLGAKLGAAFGGKEGPGIPDGMTLGKAIEEQRQFKAERDLEEAKEKALREKLKAEREAALAQMRSAVTVTLISRGIRPEYGRSGMLMDEFLVVTFGYKNNTGKDIAGVKGYVSVKDLFGDEISGFLISNDQTIKAGETATWTGSRSVKYSFSDNKDRKLADLPEDKFKLDWEPRTIVFTDGTQLTAPK